MRIRTLLRDACCSPSSASWRVARAAASARGVDEGGPEEAALGGRPSSASSRPRSRRHRGVPGVAQPDPARDQRAHLGVLGFVVLLFLLCKFAYPPVKQMMDARTERIRAELRRPTRPRPRPRACSTSTGPSSPTPRPRRRIIEEARQAAERSSATRSPAPGRAGRAAAAGATPSIDAGQGPGPGRAARQVAAARHRRWPRRSWSPASTGDADPARRELHQPGGGAALMSAPRDRCSPGARPDGSDRIDAYATALFAMARSEGSLGEVEDELFRFAQHARGQRRAAYGAHRPGIPGEPAPADHRGPARAAGPRRPPSPWCRWSSPSAGPASCPRSSDRLVDMSAAEANREVAEVRSAVPLTDDQRAPARQGARAGHRQAGRGQGHRRPVGARRHRRPGRATRSSTARSAAGSTS